MTFTLTHKGDNRNEMLNFLQWVVLKKVSYVVLSLNLKSVSSSMNYQLD